MLSVIGARPVSRIEDAPAQALSNVPTAFTMAYCVASSSPASGAGVRLNRYLTFTDMSLTVDPQAGVAVTLRVWDLSSSEIVTCTEFGLPAATDNGRAPRATVKVSSSSSPSWFVMIVPVPVVWPEATVMEVGVPTSPDSAVFEPDVETESGIVTALESALDSIAVTVTEEPSVTVVGETESETVVWRVTVTV